MIVVESTAPADNDPMRSVDRVQTGGKEPRRRSWLQAGIRLMVGLALIAFLVIRSDIGAIRQIVFGAAPLLVLFGFLLNIALLVTSAFRWRIFLKSLSIELPVATTLRLALSGSFFNAFLPTGVGGDVYKAMRVHSAQTSLASSFASVLLDRVIGLAALAAISFLVAISAISLSDTGPLVMVGLFASLAVLGVTVLLLVRGQNLVGTGKRSWFGLRPRLRRALDATAVAIKKPSTFRRAITLAILCQGFGIAAHAAIARSLHAAVPLRAIALGLLAATLASAVPVTVNGLGVREGVWVWSLDLYGIGREEALAYALLVLAVALATSALGGVVYAIGGGDVASPPKRSTGKLISRTP